MGVDADPSIRMDGTRIRNAPAIVYVWPSSQPGVPMMQYLSSRIPAARRSSGRTSKMTREVAAMPTW